MPSRPACAVVAGSIAFWLTLLLAVPAPAGVRARVGGFVHPLLAGLDHAPLISVELEVEGDAVELQRLEFRLTGSDDPGDLEQLALFSTGAERAWSSKSPVGPPQPPAEQLAFPLAQRLEPGRHVYWLACRVKPGADLSHQVTAHAPKVVLAGQELVPTDAVPQRRHRLGVAVRRAGQDGVHTSRIPALARTPRGTLLCVYDLRRRAGRDLQEDIDIGLSRSVDRGQTWEPVRVIMDMGEAGGLPQALNGCSDPGLIVDPQTGEIFCFALWMQGKAGEHQWVGLGSEPGHEVGRSAQLMLVRSRDDGVTWSPPENLTRTLKDPAWWLLAPAPQTGIALADGTLVMPMQGR
ncbi:MAG: exo-alpha-sialidase, partial [Planctomycetaceae bacterium]